MTDNRSFQSSAFAARDNYVEEGGALMDIVGRTAVTANGAAASAKIGREPKTQTERFDAIVIGAGQAGLSAGYHLARRGVSFVILDANPRIGDPWRHRWDSLRLFTPARFDGLDGMRFPAPPTSFPTKDEMADYLEAYAARFALPVQTGVRVDRLTKRGGVFHLTAGDRRYEAKQVVVAMSGYQRPRLPDFAGDLAPGIVQLHSFDYRSPSQLADGDVLLVGAGNSGSEIARELAGSRRVFMSGRDTGHVPFRIEGFAGRHLLVRLVVRGVFHHVLTTKTPLGRKMRPQVLAHGGPLIRVKPKDLAAAGVVRLPRTKGVRDGVPVMEDGQAVDVANVIWCTGFHPGFAWIDLPIFDDDGVLRHERGVAAEPGLYFVGYPFLYALSSTMIHGVGRDADYVAARVAAHAVARARPVNISKSTG